MINARALYSYAMGNGDASVKYRQFISRGIPTWMVVVCLFVNERKDGGFISCADQ